MKLSDVKCPFNSDTGTLAFTGVLGAAHAAAMIISPKTVMDKLNEDPNLKETQHANMRMAGAMAGAAAVTAIALSQKDDMAAARRMALAAQGVTMMGVGVIQGIETHKERNKKTLGWITTAVHGGVGAVCLYRGLKEGGAAK
ncbi:MAG: hypothetical protein J3K34DRAFT_408182 [Monoraphidium minutum]|nr:MAG: hypothetical protein J3K34DRAFT_408182 [Monoraphidium minutum]